MKWVRGSWRRWPLYGGAVLCVLFALWWGSLGLLSLLAAVVTRRGDGVQLAIGGLLIAFVSAWGARSFWRSAGQLGRWVEVVEEGQQAGDQAAGLE